MQQAEIQEDIDGIPVLFTNSDHIQKCIQVMVLKTQRFGFLDDSSPTGLKKLHSYSIYFIGIIPWVQ